jgi:hypothetical protein
VADGRCEQPPDNWPVAPMHRVACHRRIDAGVSVWSLPKAAE